MQDWVGTEDLIEGTRLMWNWKLNRHHYPKWDEMLDGWEKDGVRPLVYMNPFFSNLSKNPNITENQFVEGDTNGYFVKNEKNTTYLMRSISITFAQLDFSNPEAREWAKNIIKKNLIEEARAIGWMADFGEYTPTDVKFAGYDGPTATYHNRYPYEWSKLNMEAIREAGKEDEIVYFSRSGDTRSPSVNRLFWMGDQLVTYDHFDGL